MMETTCASLIAPSPAGARAAFQAFLPRVDAYAAERNFDRGPGRHDAVSQLSPVISTRLIDEETVVRTTLAHHSWAASEKFIQEVCWRTYWKGWLEMRPAVWNDFAGDLEALERLRILPVHTEAIEGRTGIECFDAWVEELLSTGYLHNHARMWFASIWIFTLRLPWQWGAAFFLRHLLDGDAASNTLSWRWVAGLQTAGKCYAARASNIAKFTGGRFSETPGLANDPSPVEDLRQYERQPLEMPPTVSADGRAGLLLTTEDVTHDDALSFEPAAVAGWWHPSGWRSDTVEHFRRDALHSRTDRLLSNNEMLREWMREERLDRVIVPWAAVGPERDCLLPQLEGVPVTWSLRDWDRMLWPYAERGYFHFKKRIEPIVRQTFA